MRHFAMNTNNMYFNATCEPYDMAPTLDEAVKVWHLAISATQSLMSFNLTSISAAHNYNRTLQY